MRPVFVGNFEYETRQSELDRLFSKYGRIERVDMKSGTTSLIGFDLFLMQNLRIYVKASIFFVGVDLFNCPL